MSSLEFDKALYREASQDLSDNEEQLKVYDSTGNCVVLAGPGSGKSKILTLKLARILNEDIEEPQGVACLTYNKECARELKEKLYNLGIIESSTIFIDTVHSFSLNHVIKPYRHLANTNLPKEIKVATSKQIRETMRQTFDLTIGKNERYTSSWSTAFNVYRRTFIERKSFEWKTNDRDIAEWILNYENSLRHQGLIDYDDMVLNGLWMIEENQWIQELLKAKFPVIAIDEYQDLGATLDRIIRILCIKNTTRLLAVGDPDQSIYGFTGAQPSLLNDLAQQPGVLKIRLKKNYRSRRNIVKASIATLLEERDFVSSRTEEGSIKFYGIRDGIDAQCDYICKEIIPEILTLDPSSMLGDIGILYIDKNDGDRIAEKVAKEGFQYIRVDGNAPYNKNLLTLWIEKCAMWCSGGWLKGSPKYSDIERTFNSFFLDSNISEVKLESKKLTLFNFLFRSRDIELKLSDWLDEFHNNIVSELLVLFTEEPDIVKEYNKLIKSAEKGQLKDFKVSSLSRQIGSKSHLNLYTLHSSKGLEFKYVIMFGLEQGRIPWLNVSEDKINESRRLFYVGLTRAKDEIHLLCSGWYYDYYDKRQNNGPSNFVLELKEFADKNL
ncbi:UvrD-helicase domain-containing protein [Bacillus altitudinis]|uniref:UvrD-helicase domain-containing protein n=1 Tax=Bacillus altitudinis TaxID=293387 RepID=UPI002041ABCD|nr:ATP-dependent helicase [Bacillus altitudinis]MCM3046629.1 ATP-dependent helicase [Bacillus altitudinis]MEC0968165.1 ATP-dependent helicase [Bacillus altitudinis]MEC1004184.1 ATP-dependent helicase [Bacillus altitudinis]MEC1805257.1 ATP-dependent helicase [Bacillus altitudinis]